MQNEIHYLSKSEAEILIKSATTAKQRTIMLLMLDAGLRVSEAMSLKLHSFDFKNKILTVKSLKKRDVSLRQIPISNRLYQSLAEYLPNLNSLEPDNFLFPSNNSVTGYLGRKGIWKMLNKKSQKLNLPNLHPHTLRHTFATHHLASGSQLAEIKQMLGHSSFDTTLIYASIPNQQLVNRINTVTGSKPTIFKRLFLWISPPRRTIINLDFSQTNFTIGRNDELQILNQNAEKGINTIIIADIGLGKSHLLNNFSNGNNKVLKLDDTENFKASLANILLLLYKEKNLVLELIWKDFDIDKIKIKVQRETTLNLCELIMQAVKPKEYILLIDDISRITPAGKKILDKLKDTFIIFTSARQVKATETAFLWNFDIIKLQPLNRSNAVKMIHQLSNGMEVENLELFRNHIYEQTNGNPRAISEMINRYKAEPFLTNDEVLKHKHAGALPEYDMTFFIIIGLGIMAAMRYASRELDNPALRMIGSIGLVLLILSRPLFRSFKRTTI